MQISKGGIHESIQLDFATLKIIMDKEKVFEVEAIKQLVGGPSRAVKAMLLNLKVRGASKSGDSNKVENTTQMEPTLGIFGQTTCAKIIPQQPKL